MAWFKAVLEWLDRLIPEGLLVLSSIVLTSTCPLMITTPRAQRTSWPGSRSGAVQQERGDGIPCLSNRYNIGVVWQVAINDVVELECPLPEAHYLKEILEAAG